MTAPLAAAPGAVRRHRFDNGLTLLVRRDPTAPVVGIVTWVNAGYFDETDDLVGIAHVLEHMYFKGTPRFGPGEIAKATKAAGGSLNAGTIYDHTAYYTTLPASALEAGLDIQFDAYAHSLIDGGELARELEVIIQEARRKADSPGAVTTETLYALLHDRHRIRRWRIGREAGLRTFDRGMVERFYRTWYAPNNTILAIVGDVDEEAIIAQVARRWGALPSQPLARDRGPAEAGAPEFRWSELDGDIAQGHAAIGWRACGVHDADAPLLDLAATILGSGRGARLYRAVRDRGLASHVGAYHYTPGDLGLFIVSLEGPGDALRDATAATWAEIAALRTHGVSAREVLRAQRLHDARWLRRLESMDAQAMHLAEWEAIGAWDLADRYHAALMAATPDDVQRAVARALDPAHAAVVAYRPRGVAPLAPEAAAARTALDAAAAARVALAAVEDVDALPARPRAVVARGATAGVARFEAGHVPILVRRRPGAPLVNLTCGVLGGALDETAANAGVTTLMARALVRGTMRRDANAVARAAEELGGSIAPSLGADSAGWTFSVPAPRLDDALALFAEVVTMPAFRSDAVEMERAAHLAELAAQRDDMYAWPVRLAFDAAWAGHPYGRSVLGTAESVQGISPEALAAWHDARVRAGSVVLAVAGDVEPERVAAAMAGAFGALRGAPRPSFARPTWPALRSERIEERDKAQTALALAYPGPGRREAQRFPGALLGVIASGLGGRFFDELRDKRSLAYTVAASPRERLLGGAFVAYIATAPAREQEAHDALLAEFARLRREPVTDDELARARAYALGSHAIRQQSGAAVLADAVDAWLLGEGLEELDDWEARIRAVTPEAIQEMANAWFDDARLALGAVRGQGRTV
ncbi:MAG: insulinase family protein [Gemmatimonadetes bacterium]|nr:insulinase family protein [Gemmatimonadota bacterium]